MECCGARRLRALLARRRRPPSHHARPAPPLPETRPVALSRELAAHRLGRGSRPPGLSQAVLLQLQAGLERQRPARHGPFWAAATEAPRRGHLACPCRPDPSPRRPWGGAKAWAKPCSGGASQPPPQLQAHWRPLSRCETSGPSRRAPWQLCAPLLHHNCAAAWSGRGVKALEWRPRRSDVRSWQRRVVAASRSDSLGQGKTAPGSWGRL